MSKNYFIIVGTIIAVFLLLAILGYVDIQFVLIIGLPIMILSMALYLRQNGKQEDKLSKPVTFNDIKTKTCNVCNTENNINRVYCKHCNTPIKNITCPVCNTKNPYDQKYCLSCDSILQNRTR